MDETSRNVDTTKIFTVQQTIIGLLSSVINDLFLQLMQYVTPEEAGELKCIDTINEAAKLKTYLDNP